MRRKYPRGIARVPRHLASAELFLHTEIARRRTLDDRVAEPAAEEEERKFAFGDYPRHQRLDEPPLPERPGGDTRAPAAPVRPVGPPPAPGLDHVSPAHGNEGCVKT